MTVSRVIESLNMPLYFRHFDTANACNNRTGGQTKWN